MGDICNSCIYLLLNHRTYSKFLGLSGVHKYSCKAGSRTPAWCTILYARRELVLSFRKRFNSNRQDDQYYVCAVERRMYLVSFLDCYTSCKETDMQG